MTKLVFLLEELSAKELLNGILPKNKTRQSIVSPTGWGLLQKNWKNLQMACTRKSVVRKQYRNILMSQTQGQTVFVFS